MLRLVQTKQVVLQTHCNALISGGLERILDEETLLVFDRILPFFNSSGRHILF